MRKKRYICIYITYKTKNEISIYSNRSAFSTAVVI